MDAGRKLCNFVESSTDGREIHTFPLYNCIDSAKFIQQTESVVIRCIDIVTIVVTSIDLHPYIQVPSLKMVEPMRTSALLVLASLWLSTTGVESSSSSSFLKKYVRDYRVHGLEDIEPAFAQFDGHMYAGLMSTIDVTSSSSSNKHPTKQQEQEQDDDDDEGALMFWLFVPSAPVYDDTLVIWLNGGPGCSSMSGCLFENCPATIPRKPAGYFPIDAQAPLEPNPYAWTHATPIMYVEQPHGTGFSQGPYPKNETHVGRDFYNFLQNLFDLFENDPEAETQLRNKRLHFFGESYAGT
jgi:hypothetical protein